VTVYDLYAFENIFKQLKTAIALTVLG